MILLALGTTGVVGIAGISFSFRFLVVRGFEGCCSRPLTKREMVVDATFNPNFSDRIDTIALNE